MTSFIVKSEDKGRDVTFINLDHVRKIYAVEGELIVEMSSQERITIQDKDDIDHALNVLTLACGMSPHTADFMKRKFRTPQDDTESKS